MPNQTRQTQKNSACETRNIRGHGRWLALLIVAGFAGAALLLLARFASPPAAAQTTTPVTVKRPVPKPDPPGTINGAVNPELIPDDVAYRLVLEGIAEPQNATDAQKARFRAKMVRAKLGADDEQALFGVLAPFQTQLDGLQAQAAQIQARNMFPDPASTDYQTLLDLSKQREQVFANALSAIPARLTSEGVAKFQAFVESEKKGMKYLPEQPMTRP